MPGGDGKSKDFYSVMGVKSDCTSSELRAAYKKLAMRWHPDKWSAKGNAKVAEESKKKFQAIQEAYSVLADEKRRFLYDLGIYEDDDDDDEMGDFLGEMAVMMNENEGQVAGSESLEELQDLFMEIFETDLNNFHTPAKPSGNKRNRTDFHTGGAARKEEIGEPSFMGSSPFRAESFSFGALDFVIVEAKRNGIRLIFSLVNNLNAYGGKGQYVEWAHATGINVGSSNDSFFSDPTIRGYYKEYVKQEDHIWHLENTSYLLFHGRVLSFNGRA